MRLLLDHGGDPTLRALHHKTPLDLASEFGKYRVSKNTVVTCLIVFKGKSVTFERCNPACMIVNIVLV